MALFRMSPAREAVARVMGEGVYLRPPQMIDYEQWARLREQSRSFLERWEPVWPIDELSRATFRQRVRRSRDEVAREEAFPFLIFRQEDDVLVGGLTVGQIRRGVSQTATIGYWMGAPYAGRGLMARALRAAIEHAFGTLRLHRLEAACLPTNTASIRLLERAQFRREGLARAYLRIYGRWQDHLLFALLDEDHTLVPPGDAERGAIA